MAAFPAQANDVRRSQRTFSQKIGLAPGGWFRSIIAWIAGGLAMLLLALTIAGYFGASWWLADLASQWQFQYAWLACALVVILLLTRAWTWLVVAGVVAGINLAVVLSWYMGPPSAASEGIDRDLRLMCLNVRVSNQDYEAVLNLIRQREPEIIVLNEVGREWLRHLRMLGEGYHLIDTRGEERFGVLVMTRIPVDEVAYVRFGGRWSPSIVVDLTLNGQRVRIIGTHPPAPTGAETWENRNEHLSELARYVQQQQVPVLVAGDLNITMFSPNFRIITRDVGLADARHGFGVLPTFPARRWGVNFPTPLRIPLDHVLVSEDWRVLDLATGPHVGSDHLPLFADLILNGSAMSGAGEYAGH